MDSVVIDVSVTKAEIEKIGKYEIADVEKLVNLKKLSINGSMPTNAARLPAVETLIVRGNDTVINGFPDSVVNLILKNVDIRCSLPSKMMKLSLCRCKTGDLKIDQDMLNVAIVDPRSDISGISITGKVMNFQMMGVRSIEGFKFPTDMWTMELISCKLPQKLDLSAVKHLARINVIACPDNMEIAGLPKTVKNMNIDEEPDFFSDDDYGVYGIY